MYPNRKASPGREPVLLQVGRFFGVPLYFAPSWVLVATLITVLYSSIVRDLVNGISTGASYAAAFGFAVALALCVLAHELGHTAVSLALGKPVRRVVIFLLGGVSEIEAEIDRARDELLIAVAGPVVSGLIAALAAAAATFAPSGSLTAALLVLLVWSNIIVAAFNLLPGLPLDGGRVLRAATWGVTHSWVTGTRIAGWAGRVIAIGLAASSVALVIDSRDPATWLLDLLLAYFIYNGATQALRSARVTDRLAAVRVSDLLRSAVLVRSDVPVAEALRQARAGFAGAIVVTDSADQVQSIVEEARVRELPPERQPWTPVHAVARALEPGLILADSLTARGLVDAIRRTPASEYLVLRPNGSLAGVFAASDLAAALSANTAAAAVAVNR